MRHLGSLHIKPAIAGQVSEKPLTHPRVLHVVNLATRVTGATRLDAATSTAALDKAKIVTGGNEMDELMSLLPRAGGLGMQQLLQIRLELLQHPDHQRL